MKLGPLEIGLIVGAIVLVFGAGKIAELGKGMGQAIGNFKRELNKAKEVEKDLQDTAEQAKN
jgi:sec-independent protein translocase protein TatA